MRTCSLHLAVAIALACAALLAASSDAVSANVYASDLRWDASAANAAEPGAGVSLRFRLNEQADLGVTLTIFNLASLQTLRSVELGPLPRGLNSYNWDLKDNSGQQVPPGTTALFRLEARSTGHQDWQQISSDSENSYKYYFPRSVFVNRNPLSSYFGWVYVNNPLPGRTTLAPYPRRTVGRGIYALRADGTDPLGQGDAALSGSVAWTGSSVSPFHIFVGEDDKLYLFDWTDDHAGVWVAPPELSGAWTALLSPATSAQSGSVSPPAVHGSISEGIVTGRGIDRALITIDEDLVPQNSGPGSTGSIWRYNLGPLDQEITTPPQLLFNDGIYDTNQYLQSGIAAADGGSFLVSQWVSNGLGLSSLYKVPPSGTQPLWRSLADWGSPDPLAGNRGAGVAYHPARARAASAAADYGRVNVGPISFVRDRWTSFGGGILTWAVGAGRAALVSAGGAANVQSFSPAADTDPDPLVALNGVHIARTGPGTNGWAVGTGGQILRLKDSVVAEVEASPVADDLYGIRALSNGIDGGPVQGWAVGDSGRILKNLNGSWVLDAAPTPRQLNRIVPRFFDRFNLKYDLYVIGNQGAVLKRLDATNASVPTQWEILYSPIAKNLNDIAVIQYGQLANQICIYVVGDTGSLMKSLNAGAYFSDRTYATTSHLRSVFARSITDVWVVGDRGFAMRTQDGETWQEVNLGVSNDLLCVWFQDYQTGWISGESGLLLRTRDGGATWTRISGVGSGDITAVTSANTADGTPRDVAFDAAGNLYVTDDTSELLRVFSPPDGLNFYVSTSPSGLQLVTGDPAQPPPPDVTAPSQVSSSGTLTASWASSGTAFSYAVGLTPEDYGQYVIGWTSTGSKSAAPSGLTLEVGRKYFWYVRARSASGVWSETGRSAGTMVIASGMSIGEARLLADAEQVTLVNKVVTHATSSEFWVQEDDRSAAIRVVSSAAPAAGSFVNVSGYLAGDGQERFVSATSVEVVREPGLAGLQIGPLALVTRAVGGESVGAAGLSNEGLLVKVAARVSAVLSPYEVMVQDTDTVSSPANPAPGLRVDTSAAGAAPAAGRMVVVTGIVRVKRISNVLTPVLEAVAGGVDYAD